MKLRYTRALIEVGRGPMSSTLIACPPWEVPILRLIHGDGNVQHMKGEEQVTHAKLLGITAPAEIEDSEDAMLAEYSRLSQYYGMHTKVEQTNCERVYGMFEDGKFERAVRRACLLVDQPIEQVVDEVRKEANAQKPELTLEQLQEQCDGMGIDWSPSMSRRVLLAMIEDATESAVSGE